MQEKKYIKTGLCVLFQIKFSFFFLFSFSFTCKLLIIHIYSDSKCHIQKKYFIKNICLILLYLLIRKILFHFIFICKYIWVHCVFSCSNLSIYVPWWKGFPYPRTVFLILVSYIKMDTSHLLMNFFRDG